MAEYECHGNDRASKARIIPCIATIAFSAALLIHLHDPAALDEPKSHEGDNGGRVARPCSERPENPTWRAGKTGGTEQMEADQLSCALER